MIYKGIQNKGETFEYNKFLAKRVVNGKECKHEGIDRVNKKGTKIRAELSGVVIDVYNDLNALKGNGIRLKTNLKYLNEKFTDIILYHDYYHMLSVHGKVGLINCGNILGEMGNSGNCWYNSNGWKKVSIKQAKNIKFQPGTHLHFDIFSLSYPEKLIKEIIKKENCQEEELLLKQWGLFFINPEILFQFLNKYINS
jgi:murein DD-endopeptidase MepM/ murein hydrolase activator NlpD